MNNPASPKRFILGEVRPETIHAVAWAWVAIYSTLQIADHAPFILADRGVVWC
jgi:hypothetical protein